MKDLKLDMTTEEFLNLIVKMQTAQLATTRKLIDLVLVQASRGSLKTASDLMLGIRQEAEAATNQLYDRIFAEHGNVDFEDLMGFPPKG